MMDHGIFFYDQMNNGYDKKICPQTCVLESCNLFWHYASFLLNPSLKQLSHPTFESRNLPISHTNKRLCLPIFHYITKPLSKSGNLSSHHTASPKVTQVKFLHMTKISPQNKQNDTLGRLNFNWDEPWPKVQSASLFYLSFSFHHVAKQKKEGEKNEKAVYFLFCPE